MAVGKSRKELQELFKTGAKPTGADFQTLIESALNSSDDGIEKPALGSDLPLRILAQGETENLLDFYAGDTPTWRVNQKPADPETSDEVQQAGLNFETANSSKLFIESSTGNVGLSSTKPTAKLHIKHSGSNDFLRIDNPGDSSTPLVVNAKGNVGIGTPTPAGNKLKVQGNTEISGNLSVSGSVTGNINAGWITSGTLSVKSIPNLPASHINSGTLNAAHIPVLTAGHIPALPASRINSGAFSAARIPALPASRITSGVFDVARIPRRAGAVYNGDWEVGIGHVLRFSASGNKGFIALHNNRFHLSLDKSTHFPTTARNASWDGDSNWDFSSDISLKTDIEYEHNILSRLMQLDVKNYRWKDNPDAEIKRVGFIAQDVEPLFPSLVGSLDLENSGESTLTLKYAEFGVLAIGGLKELKIEMDTQLSQLKAEMTAEIDRLKAKIQVLSHQKSSNKPLSSVKKAKNKVSK